MPQSQPSNDEDQEALDDLPELSDFAALRLSHVPTTRGPGSTMTSDDASSTIDSFLRSRSSFIRIKENKLKLWQSLCIELGLVPVEDPRPVFILTPLRRTTKKKHKKVTIHPSPMPSTLTQARNLLNQNAHVNISDYLATRQLAVPAGYRKDTSALLYGSVGALINYTVQTCNYTPKKTAKDEWLQPLMRDMGRS